MKTHEDIAVAVKKAAAHFRKINPDFPVHPENMIEAALSNNLPIGEKLEQDVVANTIFVAAYYDKANRKVLHLGIDGIGKLFGLEPAMMAA